MPVTQVKNQVSLARHTILETKRDNIDPYGPQLALVAAPAFLHRAAQIVYGKTRGINDQIGHFTQGAQAAALGQQGRLKPHAVALQRVRAAGGGIAADKLLIVGLQKKQHGADVFARKHAEALVDVFHKVALAQIHAQGDALEMAHGGARHHVHHFHDKAHGQTIDHKVAHIFKYLERRTFARARKARYNAHLHIHTGHRRVGIHNAVERLVFWGYLRGILHDIRLLRWPEYCLQQGLNATDF